MSRLNDYTMVRNPGDCIVCGRKDAAGVEIYRTAKRHEREHLQFQICDRCIIELRAEISSDPQHCCL